MSALTYRTRSFLEPPRPLEVLPLPVERDPVIPDGEPRWLEEPFEVLARAEALPSSPANYIVAPTP